MVGHPRFFEPRPSTLSYPLVGNLAPGVFARRTSIHSRLARDLGCLGGRSNTVSRGYTSIESLYNLPFSQEVYVTRRVSQVGQGYAQNRDHYHDLLLRQIEARFEAKLQLHHARPFQGKVSYSSSHFCSLSHTKPVLI